jgi:putative DNA primase/helicase
MNSPTIKDYAVQRQDSALDGEDESWSQDAPPPYLDEAPPVDYDDVLAEAQKLEPVVTQDGVARIFADRHASLLRFDHSAGCWFKWTGTHWQRDDTDQAFEFARRIAREKSERSNSKALKEMRRTAFAAGVERFARSDPALAVTATAWDSVPFLIGTPGGTVELLGGTLRPAEPFEMITKVTAVALAAQAACPLWLRFLDETTGGDPELIRLLQQWFGYCLTGSTREHALMFIHGDGGNGKSVFLNTITGIMGDYAVTAPMDSFTLSNGDRHPADLAMLRGARLVAASETEQGRSWAESRIKQLTGGDPISARFMRQDWFTFTPTFKMTIVGNHAPMLTSVDDAMRRRINIVPFMHKPEVPDHTLETRLRKEWPGILRWAIDGCLDWLQNGLVRPACVTASTAAYFEDQDIMGQWLAQCCKVEIGNERIWTSSSDLYRSWTAFAKTAGIKVESQKAFVAALQKRRITPHRTMHGRGFYGIELHDA